MKEKADAVAHLSAGRHIQAAVGASARRPTPLGLGDSAVSLPVALACLIALDLGMRGGYFQRSLLARTPWCSVCLPRDLPGTSNHH